MVLLLWTKGSGEWCILTLPFCFSVSSRLRCFLTGCRKNYFSIPSDVVGEIEKSKTYHITAFFQSLPLKSYPFFKTQFKDPLLRDISNFLHWRKPNIFLFCFPSTCTELLSCPWLMDCNPLGTQSVPCMPSSSLPWFLASGKYLLNICWVRLNLFFIAYCHLSQSVNALLISVLFSVSRI